MHRAHGAIVCLAALSVAKQSLADGGFKISSADGSTLVQIGTLQDLDFAQYQEDKAALANGSELRRSRLSLSGTFLQDWLYRVEYEFSGATGITDAEVAYIRLKPLFVALGQFKQPYGMEGVSLDRNVTFMERALPFAFVPARATGLMIGTSRKNWSVNGSLFGEPVGNAQAGDEKYGLVGRVTLAPLLDADHLIHFGFDAAWRKPTDDNSTNETGPKFDMVQFHAKPESDVLEQHFVDTGEIRDVDQYHLEGVEFAAERGAVSLQSEYHWVQVERAALPTLKFSGWYARLTWTVTGEARPYRTERGVFDAVRPTRRFGKDGWGAFEFAARISEINLSDADVMGGRECNATFGVNWYLNSLLRVSANYVKVLDVSGGEFAGDEPSVFEMRMQFAM